MAEALVVIPARLASQRMPGKVLADRTGKPMVQHVWERVGLARGVGRVVVATDEPEVLRVVEGFGGEAVLTAADHPNGTSRIAELAQLPPFEPYETIVNVQADEPEVDPVLIERLITGLQHQPPGRVAVPMATLAGPFQPGEDPQDPNIVKVVLDRAGRAMYFSRSLIPHPRGGGGGVASGGPTAGESCPGPLKHAGLYAYRRSFLIRYVALEPTPLERIERLEQLRALEHGYPIAVVVCDIRHHGIDTLEQYEAFVGRHLAGKAPGAPLNPESNS